MMTEKDRQKVFWLLKKYSSYTAWKALGDAYAKFVRAWERAMKLADKNDVDEFNIGAMKDFWDGQMGFDKGLPLLKRGERSVFRYRASGYLGWHASYALGYAQRIMDPQEYMFDWMKNKGDVIQAYKGVEEASQHAGGCTEPHGPDESATFGTKTVLEEKFYGPFNFPPVLPDVPPPTDITVETGGRVSADGIWEPEWIVQDDGTSLLARLTNLATGRNERSNKGCMNYLLADTVAPPYQDDLGTPVIPVRWCLIWEDTRYRDGVIPEEEAQYCAPAPQAPPARPSGRLRALHGEVVPKSGWWHTPALRGEAGFRYFKQGERFPDQQFSKWGEVIWGYDPEQQPNQ